jgi:hypothetical protein
MFISLKNVLEGEKKGEGCGSKRLGEAGNPRKRRVEMNKSPLAGGKLSYERRAVSGER